MLVTTAGAPLIGLGWRIGLLVGGFAMIGDLFSSFCKRRFGWPSSSRASDLDQVPEALLPLLACRDLLALSAADIVIYDDTEREREDAAVKAWLLAQIDKERAPPAPDIGETAPDEPLAPRRVAA